ncbi:TonB-dependent receptor [Cellvibrio sp. PSBB023]|uniref:TonB-dependent receptor n=1 Tax=Cellvibrio sp. PSBB023 TaxID=1945512 RepID=UPI00098F2067|nr:TonB-dependent receptor [Cellvibrio sp. PSBB023]AQT62119.1 TonB-dependent receptor [Cellvibrio sp. PSBB023]
MFQRSALSSAITLVVAMTSQPLYAQDSTSPDNNGDMEEVVVTGIRGSLTKALDIKRNEIQIVDAIVAEDIGKFPDNNVVEALQRVTGVQVTGRGGGEVDGVTIRGLGDVSTTVNGRQIFTSTGRSVALADIPASLLNRVDVFKTRSADQLEGGIAGNIDIKTHRPFNFDGSKVVMAARGIYQSTSEKTDPNVSMLASNRWSSGAGEFGALINLSYAETNYRDENIWIGSLDPYNADTYGVIRSSEGGFQTGTDQGLSSAPGSTLNVNGIPTEYVLLRDAMGFTDFTGKRERPAANISLQYAPDDKSEYLFETFYNGYRNQSFNSLVFINTNGASHFRNPELYPNSNVVKTNYINNANMFTSGDGSSGHTDSWVYALGGKWEINDRLKVESEIVHQTSDYEGRFFAMRTDSVRDRLVVDFNYDNGLPLVAFLDDEETPNIDESDLTNPADWSMSTAYDNGPTDSGEATTFNIDADYEADWGIIKGISFGMRYDDRGAKSKYKDQSGSCKSETGCDLSLLPGLVNISKSGFFEGKAYVPSQWLAADGNYLLDHSDEIRALYGFQAGGSDYQPGSIFDINEKTTTAYVQANYEFNVFDKPLDGQIGVRFVKVDTNMNFFENANGDGVDWQPIEDEASENRALKNFVIRYSLTDQLMTRFTYGETIRRPGYGDLNPARTYRPTTTGLEFGTASGGNPNLKPAESVNYDWSLEYYFAESSSLYAVLFRRDVEGFVASATTNIEVTGNANPDLNGKYRLTLPSNTSNGQLNGVELGLVYFPDNLPTLLDGLGVQASVTLLDGETYDPVFDEDNNIIARTTNDMYGVSDTSYSIVLAYEKERFDARLSYVWRDDFKTGFNGCCSMPGGTWSASEASMDFQLSYDVTDNMVVTFDATNITDEIYKGYYTDDYLYNNGASIFARTYALGVRYSF